MFDQASFDGPDVIAAAGKVGIAVDKWRTFHVQQQLADALTWLEDAYRSGKRSTIEVHERMVTSLTDKLLSLS